MMPLIPALCPGPGRDAGSGAPQAGSTIMTITMTGTHPGAGTV